MQKGVVVESLMQKRIQVKTMWREQTTTWSD